MIRVLKPAVATSVQDQGRFGLRGRGLGRSGAIDPLALEAANRLVGAKPTSAGLEFGPGSFSIEVTSPGILVFGGAIRDGAPWWQAIQVITGQRFDLSAPKNGVWSYLSLQGGVDSPIVMGSRSTQVREGIGSWVMPGHEFRAGSETAEVERVQLPDMDGPIRIQGVIRGKWRVSSRVDRMGYELETDTPRQRVDTLRVPGDPSSGGPGDPSCGGRSSEWSEPLLPGCIQLLPSGNLMVIMVEDPVAGGYDIPAIVESSDLRLVAQRRPGQPIDFQTVSDREDSN